MKKVLILTRDFPPYCDKVGWMLRSCTMANFLSNSGFKVFVLATKRSVKWDNLISINPEVSVSYLKTRMNYYNVSRSDLTPWGYVWNFSRKVFLKIFGDQLIDGDHLDNRKIFRGAKRLIQKNDIKIVITSTPPHSFQMVGLRLKKLFGERIMWISDFRDPWTLRTKYWKKVQKHQKKMDMKEQEVLENNDLTIFVSYGMEQLCKKRFRVKKSIVIENGYLPLVNAPAADSQFQEGVRRAHKENRLVLGYFGVGGSGKKRNDGKDIGILFDMLNKETALAKRVAIFIQGDFKLGTKLSNEWAILIFPGVPYERAIVHMTLLDIGLFFYNEKEDAPLVMGGKTYDYAGSGIPIWLIVPENATSLLSFAKKTKKPFVSNAFSEESIRKTLKNIIKLFDKDRLSERGYSEDERLSFSRDFQYKKLLDAV